MLMGDNMLVMKELSEVIKAFRARFHLSKAKAAGILGISISYMRSLEEGFDVTTGLAFKPREATLRQLAAKMTEFGYPVTFEQLMAAARTEQSEHISVPSAEKPSSPPELPAPLSERPTHGEFPLTDWEWSILKDAMDLGISSNLDSDVAFLDQAPENRKYVLKNLESFIESVKQFKKWNKQA